MNRDSVTLGIARSEEFPEILEFYKNRGYHSEVSPADTIVVERIEGRLVAAVRLCDEGDVLVLRGMQVHPEYQRRGLGTMLLRECVPILNRKLSYCLPYHYLISFYQRIDFQFIQSVELPSFLHERLAGYLASGYRLIAMRRSVSNAVT